MSDSDQEERVSDQINSVYGTSSVEEIERILIPLYFPIRDIENVEDIDDRGSEYSVIITIDCDVDSPHVTKGATGKVVSEDFVDDSEPRQPLGKVRIHSVEEDFAVGEFAANTGNKSDLEEILPDITTDDYVEIDRFGISGKLTSSLSELNFADNAKSKGYSVTRMPEDIAQHIAEDGHPNFDFKITKGSETYRVEVKSLWGTDTTRAKLYHSTSSKEYETSSCKFETQDIFAVNLWMRTGDTSDFAYAVSEYEENHTNGLSCSTSDNPDDPTDYVNQNPVVDLDSNRWFSDLDDVCSRISDS